MIRPDPASDAELENAYWWRIFRPYDFIPTVMVPEGMEKADRAVRLLKHWRQLERPDLER